MRRPETLDPAVAAELEALDAAISGAPGADPQLAMLAEDLRAIAPAMRERPRAALDARVAAGFPRRSWRPRLGMRTLLPATAVVAVAIVALVAVAGGGEDRFSDSGGGAAAPESASRSAAPQAADSAAAPSASVAPGVAGAPVPAQPGRRVERSARLDLGARADRFDAVTDGVVRTTQRHGGHVAGSQIGRDGSRGTASFVLRVPTGRLDAAIADLSRLAHVRSIEQATQDLTGAHDGTAARLRDARTQRRALVAALATAQGREADRLRARLSDVSARVRRLERELRALDARTSFATIDLTVTAARPSAGGAAPGDRWGPGDAWRDARRGLEIAAGVLLIGLAFALPLALLGGIGALGAGALRRRRRDHALDAA